MSSSPRDLGSASQAGQSLVRATGFALALIVLSLWLVANLLGLVFTPFGNYVVYWLKNPMTRLGSILFFAASFHHSALGLQTIVEDYIHRACIRWAVLLLVQGLTVLLAVG
jgi:succinate dehydrogenase / fumarate reductase membrane anchor subunit